MRHASRCPELALVGNGPMQASCATRVDASARVVRFNDAKGFGDTAGSRIDDLFLVNRGGAPAAWLEDPRFASRPHVEAASRVLLPLHDRSGFLQRRIGPDGRVHRDDVDHSVALRSRLRNGRRTVVQLGPEHHERCCRELRLIRGEAATGAPGEDPDRRRPSTGYLALSWFMQGLPAHWILVLYGFGFDGWAGHPWERERASVAASQAVGRVRFGDGRPLPVRATG